MINLSALKIINKDAQIVPLEINSIQTRYLDAQSNRDIILKSRQVGISTIILAQMYLEAITTPNLLCSVISQEEGATKKLLEKVKVFQRELTIDCERLGFPAPKLFYNSANEMSFPESGSSIYIGTAGKRAFSRGVTAHRVHCSEMAFWPEDQVENLIAGIEEAVPDSGRITIESTPNGMGGIFYRMVQEAMQGDGDYKLHFYPWWEHSEYFYPNESVYVVEGDHDPLSYEPDELALVELHNLTPDQIRWRRRRKRRRKELYPQEYPEDKVSCFIGSQFGVFPSEVLSVYARHVSPPLETRNDGLIRIWEKPRPTSRYVIGADTAEGDAKSLNAAAVIDIAECKHVATIRGRISDSVFGYHLANLGHEYNTALMAVERNNTGHSVINTLVNVMHYENMYRMIKQNFKGIEDKIGWQTSGTSKPQMISEMKTALEAFAFRTQDELWVSEASNYVYLDGTHKTGAKDGTDDLVDAVMIGMMARGFSAQSLAPRSRPRARTYAPRRRH